MVDKNWTVRSNVFQPVSSNQYGHRPRDKNHLRHCLRIITQRTSEFTWGARGSNERCLPERRASSREKIWRETELSQFNDTKVLSTSINEQLTSMIHIWFLWYRDLLRHQSNMQLKEWLRKKHHSAQECVRRRLRHTQVRQGKHPHCKLGSLTLLFEPTGTVSSDSQGFPRSLR